jgi:aspartate carbamoyltransferase catalytic subunit
MNKYRHIIGLRYLDTDFMDEIFRKTSVYKEYILRKKNIDNISEGKSVINLFFEDSTRTRISFERSEKMLGMESVNFSYKGSSLSKGESFTDTLKNIEAMKFDFMVIRHSHPGIPLVCMKYTSAKIINAGDGTNEHPTQGLLDIYTLREHFGELRNLNVCIVGNISHSRVALSNIFGLKKFGANVSVCGPLSFIPKMIEGLGVNVYTDINDAIKKNDVLNVLRVQMERKAGTLLPSLSEFSSHYCITEDRIRKNRGIKILHPGPMNINVEITAEVSVSENSLIFDQVTNGLAVKCAIFKLLDETKH